MSAIGKIFNPPSPQPIPVPEPIPTPTKADAQADAAEQRRRRAAAMNQGRQATMLGGSSSRVESSRKPTLLGE
jgi:hypothetical protein